MAWSILKQPVNGIGNYAYFVIPKGFILMIAHIYCYIMTKILEDNLLKKMIHYYKMFRYDVMKF